MIHPCATPPHAQRMRRFDRKCNRHSPDYLKEGQPDYIKQREFDEKSEKSRKKVKRKRKICPKCGRIVITTKQFANTEEDFPMIKQLTEIFCDIDDFCKGYEEYCTQYLATQVY